MKRWRLGLCLMLIAAMLAGDLSLLHVHAENTVLSVSGNDADASDDNTSGAPSGGTVTEGPVENPEENLPSDSGEVSDVSGNDFTVSDNDITVSDNDLTVSGNDLEEDIAWEDARAALKKLAGDKLVLALVYLTDSYAVRKEPGFSSEVVVTVLSGQSVQIRDVAVEDHTVWYQAELDVDGSIYTGWLERAYLAYADEDFIDWEENYLFPYLRGLYGSSWKTQCGITEFPTEKTASAVSSGYADINQFPQSYWSSLVALKRKYPNWQFVKLDVTNLDFNAVVNAQYGERSYIYYTAPADYKERQTGQANWYYASKKAITNYLDPRNHLSENEVFQFEQLSYNSSYHSESALQGILSSTFMAGMIPGENMSYARAFMQIGNNYGVSPYHLASRVVLEQGTQGTSSLISGNYPGYKGYYNYFNVGATGKNDTEVIVNGLAYAKSQGWNTRYKSLSGGAGTISTKYIGIGQDTLYLQKFQVIKAGGWGLYTHQYQQNIQAPTTEGRQSYNTYKSSGSLNNRFVFRIPVYSNMPVIVKKVELSEKEKILTITQKEENGKIVEQHESFRLTATVTDTDDKKHTDYPVTWKSENPNIAKVDKDGVVTTVMGGTTNIVVSAGGKTAKCKVTVKAPLYKLEIIPPSGELYVGESMKLAVRYIPLYTSDPVENMTWSSSDESVVTVRDGLIIGKKTGNATITAKVTGEDGTEHAAEYEVTVKPCTVQIFDAEGQLWEEHELDYGDSLEGCFPDITELEGHESEVFSGWYTKPDGEGFRCTEETLVYGDMKLYPYFITTDQDFFVKSVGDYTYTGAAITPEVVVYDGEVLLVKGKDYTVSYANNKAVAGVDSKKKPTIVVKGKGNYSGVQKVYFNIVEKNISESDITVDDMTYTYTGKTLHPSPVVYRNGKKLKKNTDYKVLYPAEGKGAYISPGVFPIEIQGIKNYTGTKRVYLTITQNVLLSKVSVASVKSQEYDEGNPIEPALTIKYKGKLLEEGTHYTVEYRDNTEIGTASAVITAVKGSGYAGTRTVKFKITGIAMSKVKVSGITAKTYCGVPITIFDADGTNSGFFPEFTISYTKKGITTGLELGKDYTIEYSRNDTKGKAVISFKGINHYTGTLKKSFTIGAYDIAANPEGYVYLKTSDLGKQEYSRAGVKPKVTLYFKGISGAEEELQEGVDYTLSYRNHTKVNDGSDPDRLPSVTIKGKGRFKGTWKNAATYTIGAKSIEEGADNGITVKTTDFVYKEGKEDYPPKVVVKDNGKTLKAGKDYEIVSWMAVSTGDTGIVDYEAELRALPKEDGTAEYVGTRTVTYRVFLYALKNAAIQKIPSQTFDDKVANSEKGICPEITVTYKLRSASEAELFTRLGYEKFDTKTKLVIGQADGVNITLKKGDTVVLKEDRDYVFQQDSYKNNRKKGTAKVTVYGKGLFSGSKAASFKITGRPLVKRILDMLNL